MKIVFVFIVFIVTLSLMGCSCGQTSLSDYHPYPSDNPSYLKTPLGGGEYEYDNSAVEEGEALWETEGDWEDEQ